MQWKPSEGFSGLTLLPLSDGPPAARRKSTRDLLKVNVIVPVLIEGVKQAWERETAFKVFTFHTLHHTRTLTFTQRGVDGRRDQGHKSFQVKAAGSGLGFQQPISLL